MKTFGIKKREDMRFFDANRIISGSKSKRESLKKALDLFGHPSVIRAR
jgi:hypothetical protein